MSCEALHFELTKAVAIFAFDLNRKWTAMVLATGKTNYLTDHR